MALARTRTFCSMNYVTNLPPCVNHFIVLNLNIRPMLFSRCHYTVFFCE